MARSRQVKSPYEPQRSNYSRLNGQDRREKISEQVPLGTLILRVKQWQAQQRLLFHTLKMLGAGGPREPAARPLRPPNPLLHVFWGCHTSPKCVRGPKIPPAP